MKHLIIIGVGGFAREVCWHAENSLGYGTEWDLKGFLDGDVRLAEDEYKKLRYPLLGDIASYALSDDDVFVCAIANPHTRKKLSSMMEKKGGTFINLIHRTAMVAESSRMGIGCILTINAIVSCDCNIGNHLIMNCASGIGHDAKLGDYVSLMSNVSVTGNTRIGSCAYFSSGSCVCPRGRVDDDAYVGVASVVFKHVKAGQKVFGNPAFPI